MKRNSLLVPLALVICAASMGTACFILRNTIADQLSWLLFDRGSELSVEQANHLEQKLKSGPDNYAIRIELLSFYSSRKIEGTLSQDQMLERRDHILWVIDHQPASNFASNFAVAFDPESEEDDSEGLQEAKQLWLRQVDANPSNSRILYNAGKFFFWIHNLKESEQLLERASRIEPHSYKIASSLGGNYWHDARYAASPAVGRKCSNKALQEYEEALRDARSENERRFVLPDAAQSAYAAGSFKKASDWSAEMLTMADEGGRSEDYSDEIHYGHLVLGMIALQNGDTKSAGAHLVASAAVAGNPHLDSYGPNMMLAKELLEKGDREPVLAYLKACSKFWKMGDKQLAGWRTDIAAGKMPDFGSNLHY